MGQKVHPLIQRIGINKNWSSRWFANKKEFSEFLREDVEIRKFIKERFVQAAVSNIVIERLAAQMRIRIFSARPGIIIGRHGADIERLREDLKNITQRDMLIDIEEIKNPFAEAQLIAENVAFQLEKRVAFKRAMKRCIEQAMKNGAKGIRIACAGRLGGSEMSRREGYKMGKIPLQTLRADIDYGFTEAHTTYGTIGVKVWVYKGDSLLTNKQEGSVEGKVQDGSNA
jgi:small subunit ribosomal protein S3